ncbi:MAG: heterodisulfide reductase-related iron-sulfur binding cluster [Thermoleophilaceae bacterium]
MSDGPISLEEGPARVSAWDATRPPEPKLIDDCVHCGFCLATCPTYVLWGEEADSPRGRIVLMKEGNEEGSEISEPMVRHFDNCLGCMACVTSCPSGVQYDKLIEDTRGQVERNWQRDPADRWFRRLIFSLFPYPRRLRALMPLMRIGKATGLERMSARMPLGRLATMAGLAPPPARRITVPERIAAVGESRGTVALLQGCVQRVFFAQVNAATAALLSAEGYNVHTPDDPQCCGALELHSGSSDAARERAKLTIAALEGYEKVVSNAAGCGSAMKDYGHVLRDDPEWSGRAEAFSAKVVDVTELLTEGEPRAVRQPLEMRVAYHDACHLAHAQNVREQPRELLRSVPGLEIAEPEDWEICCGSAGIYNMVRPEPAEELGRRKAQALIDTGVKVIAAGNPGCAIQIQAHARKLGHELEVVHPVELLWRSVSSTNRGEAE